MDNTYFADRTVTVADNLAACLRYQQATLDPATDLIHAVNLIVDWVRFMKRPDLAASLAIDFHPVIERWSAWKLWVKALEILLPLPLPSYPQRQRVLLLNYHSQVARELHDFAVAQRSAEQALAIAHELDEPSLLMITWNKLGVLALRQDDLIQANEYFQKILNSPQLNDNQEHGHMFLNLGVLLTRQGDYKNAYKYFQEALTYYSSKEDHLNIAKTYCNLADLQIRRGIADKAPEIISSALKIFKNLNNTHEYAESLNDLGCAYMKLNMFELSLSNLQEAYDIFEGSHSVSSLMRTSSNIIELYVNNKLWQEAQELIEQTYHRTLEYKLSLIAAAIDIDWGRMLYSQGKYEQARDRWQSALELQQLAGAFNEAHTTEILLTQLDI